MSFCWKLRWCALRSNVIFSCSLVNLTVLRKSAPLKRPPWVHVPHAWGTCYAHAPLTSFLRYTAGQSTGHQIKNWKNGPAWISYSRISAFYTKFNVTTPELLVFLQLLSLSLLLLILLLVVSILLLYLWIVHILPVHTWCIICMFMFWFDTHSWMIRSVGVPCTLCIAHTMSTRSISPVGIQYAGIYLQHYSRYIVYSTL